VRVVAWERGEGHALKPAPDGLPPLPGER